MTIVLDTIILCIDINNPMKFKHAAARFTYTHVRIGSLHKNKKNHIKSCPAAPLIYTNIPTPPPPPHFVVVVLFSCLIKILLPGKINILALVYMKINFSTKLMLKIHNLSRKKLPPPPLRIIGRPLRWPWVRISIFWNQRFYL